MLDQSFTAYERQILSVFDDVAATILVLQRDGFTCRARENLMENFTRHSLLFFGGIISADGVLHEAELKFFSYVVRHQFTAQEFERRLSLYQRGKSLEEWADWVPEYLDTLMAFDKWRETGVTEQLLEALETLSQMFCKIDGAVHPAETALAKRHLSRLREHVQANRHRVKLERKNSASLPSFRKTPERPQPPLTPSPPTSPPPKRAIPPPIQPPAAQVPAYGPQATPVSERQLDQILAEVQQLIGLEPVKAEISNLVNMIRVSALRRKKGLPVPPLSLHLIFTGNPGTGKTTIARKLAEMYRVLGVLSQGHLIEVDRSGLVAGYMGQTAIKTREVIDSALGGILFVDEAYALATGQQQDYGQEAIDTLLKAMEDHRDDLIVIVAGYPNEMKRFIGSNPGLQSRFKRTIHFPDYAADELFAIFEHLIQQAHLELEPAAQEFVQRAFGRLYQQRGQHFGNGRTVRNIFEQTLVFQANRVMEIPDPQRADLILLDVRDVIAGFKSSLKGF